MVGAQQIGRTLPGRKHGVVPDTWWGIIRVSEIALKKGNRHIFLGALRHNIDRALAGLDVGETSIRPNRGFIQVRNPDDWPAISERLSYVFGIQNYSLALASTRDMDAWEEAFFRLGDAVPGSFAVRATRGDKSFPLNSQDIERELGGRIQRRTGASVDLTNPATTYHVEVQPEAAFVYRSRVAGPGGLPVKTGGRVAVLLSGGIDSPVAAFRMIRRGCVADFVHFSSFPFTDASSQEKARELAHLLTRYQFQSRLHIVPFGEVQKRIVVAAPAPYRVLLYRRMMLRVTERIAKERGCNALVTGESLGQVSSQTLTNMSTVGGAVRSTILRPLVGFDKHEVVEQARAIGTYDISIEPDMDCCQYLVPEHVKTRSTPSEIEEIEAELPIDELVEMALEGIEVEEYVWPAR